MRRQPRLLAAASVAVALAAGMLAAVAPSASAAGSGLSGDFDGDGHRDVAVASGGGAGRVTVLYGSAQGIDAARRVVIDQNSPGVPGANEADDRFGAALVAADLDRDGYSDLVVAAPGERFTADPSKRGSLTVLWGGPKGLQGGTGLPVYAEARQLSAADVDRDGRTDLLVNENGGVTVVRGPFTRTGGTGRITRQSVNAHPGDMAVADFDGDGRVDLLMSEQVPYESDSDTQYYTRYLKGTADGFVLKRTWPWARQHGAVAAGDLNHDGYADVALGNDSAVDSVVTVVYGSAAGLGGGRANQRITQDTAGVPGTDEPGDNWGDALSIGDVDGDHYPDLAIGAWGEDLASVQDTGSVTLLRGSSHGLVATGAQMLTQDSPGVPGHSEKEDGFGTSLLLTDTDRDGRADLVVSASGLQYGPDTGFGTVGENGGAGMVWRLPATAKGLTGTGSTLYGGPAGAMWFGSPLAG